MPGPRPRFPQLYDREWLTERRVVERQTVVEIAAECGCSRQLVQRALERLPGATGVAANVTV